MKIWIFQLSNLPKSLLFFKQHLKKILWWSENTYVGLHVYKSNIFFIVVVISSSAFWLVSFKDQFFCFFRDWEDWSLSHPSLWDAEGRGEEHGDVQRAAERAEEEGALNLLVPKCTTCSFVYAFVPHLSVALLGVFDEVWYVIIIHKRMFC